MAIYNGEKLDVGYNRTPTKFYKKYADRIKKVEEFRILQDTYKREMCDLKQENHRLKHELDSFIRRACWSIFANNNGTMMNAFVNSYEGTSSLYSVKHLPTNI